MSDFLLLATVYLATMIVAVPVSTRLGLGSVLGYLIAGIIIFGNLGATAAVITAVLSIFTRPSRPPATGESIPRPSPLPEGEPAA